MVGHRLRPCKGCGGQHYLCLSCFSTFRRIQKFWKYDPQNDQHAFDMCPTKEVLTARALENSGNESAEL